MKALEVLNRIDEQIKRAGAEGFAVGIYLSKDFTAKIKEAIEELENIQCIKLGANTQGLCFEKDFYCKNWEPNDNKQKSTKGHL